MIVSQIVLGIFALPELCDLAITRTAIASNARQLSTSWEGMRLGARDCFTHWWLVLRCSWIGAFLGAIVFVLLQTFAIDLFDRERFNLVIGGVFLAIVLFSPDGLLGLWAKLRSRFGPRRSMTSQPRRQA